MRCCVQDNGIIAFRQEGIFLCLDGSQWSPLWDRLSRFLRVQCTRFDIPLRFGLLSWTEEVEAPPAPEFLAEHALKDRGRFLAPLIEKVFPALPARAYNLFVISAGTVYDWDDWTHALGVYFNKACLFFLAELEQQSQMQLEEFCLKNILGEPIQHISVSSRNSVLYDFPVEMSIQVENETLKLEKSYDAAHLDFPVKAFGPAEYATLLIESHDLNEECRIKITTPEIISFSRQLAPAERELLTSAVACYAQGDVQHYCPLCDKSHAFTSPLRCRYQKSSSGGIFNQTSFIFQAIEKARQSTDRYVIFRQSETATSWALSAMPILAIDAGEFIVMTSSGEAMQASIRSSVRYKLLENPCSGLFLLPNTGIFVVRL